MVIIVITLFNFKNNPDIEDMAVNQVIILIDYLDI